MAAKAKLKLKIAGTPGSVMSSIKPTFQKVADMMGGVGKSNIGDPEPAPRKMPTRPAAEGLKRAPRLKFGKVNI